MMEGPWPGRIPAWRSVLPAPAPGDGMEPSSSTSRTPAQRVRARMSWLFQGRSCCGKAGEQGLPVEEQARGKSHI